MSQMSNTSDVTGKDLPGEFENIPKGVNRTPVLSMGRRYQVVFTFTTAITIQLTLSELIYTRIVAPTTDLLMPLGRNVT